MKIYLDACCLNRLTDDQTQSRIRQEAEALEQVFRRVRDGFVQWISSEALVDEIARNPNIERRLENSALLTLASEVVAVNAKIASRARELQAAGYGAFDSLHLACAEAVDAEVLLTTDDRLLRKASRGDGRLRVAVRNPLSWSQESLP